MPFPNRMLVNHMYAGGFTVLTGLRLSADPDVFDLFIPPLCRRPEFGAFYNTDLDIALAWQAGGS